MFHPFQRHTVIVLADRVLHIVRTFGDARLRGQAILSGTSAAALLAEALPKFECAGRATLVLGNPWSQLDLIRLPVNAKHSALDNDRIAQAQARSLAPGTADASTEWCSRSSRLRQHLLVAATPADTIDAITAVCAQKRLVPGSIQPLWTWLTMGRSPRFRANRQWSVLAEPGFVTITHQTQGELDYLRTLRTDGQRPAIDELLARQAAASGFTAAPAEAISFGAPLTELSAPWLGSPACHQVFA